MAAKEADRILVDPAYKLEKTKEAGETNIFASGQYVVKEIEEETKNEDHLEMEKYKEKFTFYDIKKKCKYELEN